MQVSSLKKNIEKNLIEFLIFLSIFPLLLFKGIAATFGTILFFTSLILSLKRHYRIKLLSQKNNFFILIFFLTPFFAIFFSQLLRWDFNVKAFDGPIRFIFAIPLFIYVKNINFDCTKIIKWAIPISTISLFIFSLISNRYLNLNLFHSPGGRLTVSHVDPIIFGNYSIILSFCCLFLIREKINKNLLVILLLGFMSGLTLSIQSQSRSGWIAGIFLLTLLIILNWKVIKSHKTVATIMGLALLATAITTLLTNNIIASRILIAISEIQQWFNNPDVYTSTGTRLSMWKLSGYLFSLNPLSGYGDKNFDPSFLTNQTLLAIGNQGGVETIYCCGPHNELLGHLLRSGIFGLAAYFCTYAIPLYFFTKFLNVPQCQQASMLGICLITGMAITGFSSEMLSLKFTFTFYALFISILLGSCLKNER